jgi:hypothetical protein
VTEVLNAIDLSMERMTPSPDLLKTYNERVGPINVKIQLQRSREMKVEHDGLQAALRFWPPKYVPLPFSYQTKEVRADDRSIPAIIATTKQSGLDNVLEGPNMDMERQRQLRLKGKQSNGRQMDSQSYLSTTASASATASIYMDTTSTGTSSTSITSCGGHHKEVDEFLTNTVPGFNYLGQNPLSTSNSSYSSPEKFPAGSSAQNEPGSVWSETAELPNDNVNVNVNDSTGDQSFWDLINGGTVDDLDFSALLQNFNEDGSAT